MSNNQVFDALPEPKSRTAAVAEIIRQAILSGGLSAGDILVERKLSEQLGVSKTPVREALISLNHSGLVSFNPYRGVVVREVDETLVRTVYEMRELLEPYAIHESVPRHDESSIGNARRLLRNANEAGKERNWAKLSLINREFHRTLYERCSNELLISTLNGIQDQVALCAVTLWHRDPVWKQEILEHQAMLDAIINGSDTAKPVRDHIRNSADRLISSLSF